MTASEVLQLIADEDRAATKDSTTDREYHDLKAAILGLAGGKDGRMPSVPVLGRELGRVRDRVSSGKVFRCDLDKHTKVGRWRVLNAGESAPPEVVAHEPTGDRPTTSEITAHEVIVLKLMENL